MAESATEAVGGLEAHSPALRGAGPLRLTTRREGLAPLPAQDLYVTNLPYRHCTACRPGTPCSASQSNHSACRVSSRFPVVGLGSCGQFNEHWLTLKSPLSCALSSCSTVPGQTIDNSYYQQAMTETGIEPEKHLMDAATGLRTPSS